MKNNNVEQTPLDYFWFYYITSLYLLNVIFSIAFIFAHRIIYKRKLIGRILGLDENVEKSF